MQQEEEEEEEKEGAFWLQEKTSLQQALNIEQTAAADRDWTRLNTTAHS